MKSSEQSFHYSRRASNFNDNIPNDDRRSPLTPLANYSYQDPELSADRRRSKNSDSSDSPSSGSVENSSIYFQHENDQSIDSICIPLDRTDIVEDDYQNRNSSNRRIGITTILQRLFGSINLTTNQHLVLKCSFAYFIASLFTFVPFFNSLIGNNRTSSHLVATATVFFNPAKTLGGMVEAAAYGWGYLLFAVLICLLSMSTTAYLEQNKGWETVAHMLNLFFWLAGSTFIVSYLKAHWNKPAVASASSLCFITLFIIIVREESMNLASFDTIRVQHITTAVATGTLITVACCIIFWPISACDKLNQDICNILEANQSLIKLLTDRFFLNDSNNERSSPQVNISEQHKSQQQLLDALYKSFKEAKLEGVWNGQVRGRVPEYNTLIKSLNQLIQFTSSLQISCGLDAENADYFHDNSIGRHKQWNRQLNSLFRADKTEMNRYSDSISESSSYPAFKDDGNENQENSDREESSPTIISFSASNIKKSNRNDTNRNSNIEPFITLNMPQTTAASPPPPLLFTAFYQQISPSLKSLICLYSKAMDHLQQQFKTNRKASLAQLESELNQAISICLFKKRQSMEKMNASGDSTRLLGPDFFHFNFFLFNIVELCEELRAVLKAVNTLNNAEERQTEPLNWKFVRDQCIRSFLPKKNPVQVYNLHTPAPDNSWRRFLKKIWNITLFFKLRTTRYGIRATIATVLLAIPAFYPSTCDLFRNLRMEWALITLMVVLAPTVGQTNIVAIYRILSTVIGCFTAALFYTLFPANIIMLPLLTWLFSIPNFWLILTNKHGKFGQFTLLAYNLVLLTKYNDQRNENTMGIWLLATQRCFAIFVGVVVGLVVTAYILPFKARAELRTGLGNLLLRLAWYYQELVFVFSRHENHDPSDAVTNLPRHYKDAATFMQVELDLQSLLVELEVYLSQTPKEFRLKGPFPVSVYRGILYSSQKMVDTFIAIRMIVSKNNPIKSKALVGNILLYLYTLGSALHLKTPMPPYLPPVRLALESIILNDSSQNELDYHYLMLTNDIIDELEMLGNKTKLLFGSLVPEWDLLFHKR